MRDGRELVDAIRAALLAEGYVLVEEPEPVAEGAVREECDPVGA